MYNRKEGLIGMETTYWKVNQENSAAIQEAASRIKSGDIVAFPTETVYGLGADATNAEAVAKIFIAKGRPQDNPLIAHVANKEQLYRLVQQIPGYVEPLLHAFTPGPLTFVLPSNGVCAPNVTAGLSTIAVRIPDHPIALALIEAANKPLAAPSANLSGKPSPTTAGHVAEDLNGKIAGILDGGPTGVGVESTVLDCTKETPVILRPGGITSEQIAAVLEMDIMAPVKKLDPEQQPKSPGMKYKHYSPEVPLWLVEGKTEDIQALIDEEKQKGKKVGLLASNSTAMQLQADEINMLGDHMEAIAANLYHGLRHFKEGKVDLLICEAFPEEGIGLAIMNRLKKAASSFLHLSSS